MQAAHLEVVEGEIDAALVQFSLPQEWQKIGAPCRKDCENLCVFRKIAVLLILRETAARFIVEKRGHGAFKLGGLLLIRRRMHGGTEVAFQVGEIAQRLHEEPVQGATAALLAEGWNPVLPVRPPVEEVPAG